jgi:hypothetical protein
MTNPELLRKYADILAESEQLNEATRLFEDLSGALDKLGTSLPIALQKSPDLADRFVKFVEVTQVILSSPNSVHQPNLAKKLNVALGSMQDPISGRDQGWAAVVDVYDAVTNASQTLLSLPAVKQAKASALQAIESLKKGDNKPLTALLGQLKAGVEPARKVIAGVASKAVQKPVQNPALGLDFT